MQVKLIDFRQDEEGHWVAVLSCGHTQHLRHQPPWQNRAWVLDETHRKARLGEVFNCGWCAKNPNTGAALPEVTTSVIAPKERNKEQ
ncbi:DUF3565 domain-containing protein [Pseudomonas sp. TTU2014-080ASC]|uniref:DUF3565 domain-containing protein n=1 Tax=Pseudomonas sp. TTU2014-080ASC TaxID=1729724 RepID=UPI000A6DD631